ATQTKSVTLSGTSEKVEVSHPCRGRPWGDERCPAATRHDRLAVEHAGPSRNRYPNPIDLQPVEPFDTRLDDLVIPPTDEPVRGCPVEEVVLAGTFPDEMPSVPGIDPDRAAEAAVARMKRAGRGRVRPPLAIIDRVDIVARRRWHESNAVYASVLSVAK